MLTCLTAILNGGAALFALLAAAAWFKAARAPLPWSEGAEASEDTLIISEHANMGAIRGAKWNRWAAICAGVSAGMQAVALILPHCGVDTAC